MSENYVVKQGDYLSSIAQESGFLDYRTIWNHPNNAELRQQRGNPDVLYPGDLLFIPDKTYREQSCATDQRHRFVAKSASLKLRIILEDLLEKPIAGAPCDLLIEGQMIKTATDANGRFEQAIRPGVHNILLTIRDSQTPYDGAELFIKVGDLDPVTATSGQVARFNNLAYFAGDPAISDPAQFQSAVEEFQCDHDLLVDGVCGPVTQAALKKFHGC